MTTTPPEAPQPDAPPAAPRVTPEEMKDVSRLRRTTGANRAIAGVCGGIARHFDIDPMVVRVVMVVLAVFGVGLILYPCLWALMPSDDGGRAMLDLDARSLAILIVSLLVIAALLLTTGAGWEVGFVFGPPLLLVVLLVAMLSNRTPQPPRPRYGEEPAEPPATEVMAASGPPAGPTEPPAAWTPPAQPLPPRPPDPRKRGPILFWVTLALASLAMGVLGVLDLADAVPVTPSAYPALGLAVCAAMLLIGAFWGRAGGIILLGLMLAGTTTVVTIAEGVQERQVAISASGSTVRDYYFSAVGDFQLDLTDVPPEELPRTIQIDGGFTDLRVVVPDSVTTVAHTAIETGGNIHLFGESQSSPNNGAFAMTGRHRAPGSDARLRLNINIVRGSVTVVTAPGIPPAPGPRGEPAAAPVVPVTALSEGAAR